MPIFLSKLTSLFVLAGLFLMSCGSPEQNETAQEGTALGVIDALGREVTLQMPAQRIVTIAPGATEIVVAAGGLDQIVGVSNVDTYPEQVLSLPSLSVLPLDFEALVNLRPDLVFASSQVNDPQHVKVFDSLGIPVFYLDGSSWDNVFESLAKAGQLMGTSAYAAQKQASLRERVNRLIDLTKEATLKPQGIFLISDVTSYSFGKGSYVLDVFEWAGVESATAGLSTPAPVLSDEWVLMEKPDIIFGTFSDGFVPSDLLTNHPSWQDLTAIQSGSVYRIPQDIILRPGPRNVDAAYMIAQIAHPELFQSDEDQN